MYPFKFILLGVHRTSWICRLMIYSNLGNFGPLFLQISFCSFSLSFWDSHYMCVSVLNGAPQISEALFIFFLNSFFFSFWSSEWIVSIYLASTSLILFLPAAVFGWARLAISFFSFILVTVLFDFRISLCFIISFPLLLFSLCRDAVLILQFFRRGSFGSLGWFVIADLSLCLVSPTPGPPQVPF